LARLGTKRDDPIAGWHVHDAVDDDRRDLLIELERGRPRDRTAVAIEAVVPDELEAGDVLGRQPVERREARPGEIAMIVGPIRRIAPAARRGSPGGRARVLLLSERRPAECERDGRGNSTRLRMHQATPPSVMSRSLDRHGPRAAPPAGRHFRTTPATASLPRLPARSGRPSAFGRSE